MDSIAYLDELAAEKLVCKMISGKMGGVDSGGCQAGDKGPTEVEVIKSILSCRERPISLQGIIPT